MEKSMHEMRRLILRPIDNLLGRYKGIVLWPRNLLIFGEVQYQGEKSEMPIANERESP
jgi:hypothetical protein